MSMDPGRPDFRTLLDWLEGRLDADQAARVGAQVAAADERTRHTVDWLRGFLTAARELPLEEPPPIVRQSLKRYFARWSRTEAVLGRAGSAVSASGCSAAAAPEPELDHDQGQAA